jgi:hypothetical protein
VTARRGLFRGSLVTLREPVGDAPLWGTVLTVGRPATENVYRVVTASKRSGWRDVRVLSRGERLLHVRWHFTDEAQETKVPRRLREMAVHVLESVPPEWIAAERDYLRRTGRTDG